MDPQDMADELTQLRSDIDAVGQPWADHPYYAEAEKFTFLFWRPDSVFRRLFERMNLESVVELACGHGRHSENIIARAGRIALVDIHDENLAVCRQRFGDAGKVWFLKGDGATFAPIPDGSVSAAFSYDAMVHFSPAMVQSYVRDTARILRRGGMALYHHSNYAAPPGRPWTQNPHARNHMTTEMFSGFARDAGLEIVETVALAWGGVADLDALTLLRKSRPRPEERAQRASKGGASAAPSP